MHCQGTTFTLLAIDTLCSLNLSLAVNFSDNFKYIKYPKNSVDFLMNLNVFLQEDYPFYISVIDLFYTQLQIATIFITSNIDLIWCSCKSSRFTFIVKQQKGEEKSCKNLINYLPSHSLRIISWSIVIAKAESQATSFIVLMNDSAYCSDFRSQFHHHFASSFCPSRVTLN